MTPSLLEPTAEAGVFNFRFDNSSMENFITCSRKAQYHSVFKRKPAGFNTAHYFGGVAHECLEIRKQAMLVPSLTWEQEQMALIVSRFEKQSMPVDEWRTADNLVALIHKYNDTYPLPMEPFTIVAGSVEMPFSVPIGHMDIDSKIELRPGEVLDVKRLNCFWTGRIDAIVEIDGSLMVLDHKTASVMGPSYFEDFQLSAQMHGYVWASRQLGYNTSGLYLDVLGNRRPTKTGKAHELMRQRFFYQDELVEEWRNDTFTSLTDFVEHMIRNYYPKGQKWCHGKYGQCPYWETCNMLPSQRNARLFDDEIFADDTWSPLAERTAEVVA